MVLNKFKKYQHFCHWSGKELMNLASGIQKYGFTDTQKLSSIVQTKSATQVKIYIVHRLYEIRKTQKDTTDKKVETSQNIATTEDVNDCRTVRKWKKNEESQRPHSAATEDYNDKFLSALDIGTELLLWEQEWRGVEFQQLHYRRLFIKLLESSDRVAVLEATNPQIVAAFCNALYNLRPQKAPGFAYAWLELISHRVFLGQVLALSPAQNGWTMYAPLLVSLFKFLAPFICNVELGASIQLLYKGTLRVLLVLLHDFPEFLCDYHYEFCDVIPPNCIQMRNIILSAFPRNMRLPDPFTPNLKVDLLPEITQAPRILANFNKLIQPPSFKEDLDSYIKTRTPVMFLAVLTRSLQVSNEPGMRYNIPLINALVLYVGTQAISYIQNKGNSVNISTIRHSPHMDIFETLAGELDTEGRYFFLNAIANHLRHPNSHTHYFSCTLLHLFAGANTEAIQEQITRVLVERVIVNRPQPWGLMITFIELVKNQNYKFWNHEFVRCAPEIERLFEGVARALVRPKPSSEQITS